MEPHHNLCHAMTMSKRQVMLSKTLYRVTELTSLALQLQFPWSTLSNIHTKWLKKKKDRMHQVLVLKILPLEVRKMVHTFDV